VYRRGHNEKDFSLYCDPDFKSMSYAGEDVSIEAPRYSGVQYRVSLDTEDEYEGQVVGIISYKPIGKHDCVYVLINRFVTPHITNEYFKRSLPQRLVKYHKVGQQVTTDCVPIEQLINPLFIVPAMDYGNGFRNIGNADEVDARFYLITQCKVQCTNIMDYDEYLDRNNNEFSERNGNNTTNYLNCNPFLTVDEMIHVKELLNVQRNVSEYSSELIEAHDCFVDEQVEDY